MTIQVNGAVKGNNVSISIKWVHVVASLVVICATLVTGMWWLIGARTQAVLNEEFWASERIRPAMRLYIAEKTVSREEFTVFVSKWDIAMAKIQMQLDDIERKVEAKNAGKK